jgi:hypothetical protein
MLKQSYKKDIFFKKSHHSQGEPMAIKCDVVS